MTALVTVDGRAEPLTLHRCPIAWAHAHPLAAVAGQVIQARAAAVDGNLAAWLGDARPTQTLYDALAVYSNAVRRVLDDRRDRDRAAAEAGRR